MVASPIDLTNSEKPAACAILGEKVPSSLKAEWIVGSSLAGGVLGWSAPGMEQWWLAWIGLVPLFLACAGARTAKQVALLGTVFGTVFNMVYLQWYLQVRESAWTAIFALAPSVSAVVVWLAMSLWQGLFIGAVCALLHRLPLRAGFLPVQDARGKWQLPLYVVAPLLWVGLVEKVFNFRGVLGVPWSMLEYTQYSQPVMLQIAALIGGSGLACAIVLCNVVIASLIATAFGCRRFAFEGLRSAVLNVALAAFLLAFIPLFGAERLAAKSAVESPMVSVAALQGNLSSAVHKVPLTKSIEREMQLAIHSNADICVWPEWSVPIDWRTQKDFVQFFAHEARLNKQAWVIGTFDTASGASPRLYNSVGVVRADGGIADKPYHKQYLVPFGEYIPDWLSHSVLMPLLDPRGEARRGVNAGDSCAVLDAGKAKVGPLICFENCRPDIAASSVRSGAQLLVDCSNTSWFNYSNVLGRQLIAFSVMRAVENHRSFVFCTMLGPSAIIDPNGRIMQQAHLDQPIALEASVPLEADVTPFTRMCTF